MKAFYILLFILCSQFYVEAQVDCPDPIDLEVCNGYFYIDGNFDANATYHVRLSDGVINFSHIVIASDDGIIAFPLALDFPNGGLYKIYEFLNPIDPICQGFFTVNVCNDFLIFPLNYCFIEHPDETTPCDELGFENTYYSIPFCIGDTTRVNISSAKHEIEPNTYLPFSIDRLTLHKGTVITADEFGFDVVWDVLGEECVILTTNTSSTGDASSGVPIKVEPTRKIEIFSENIPISTIDVCIDENINLSSNIEDENLKWVASDGRIIRQTDLNISFPFSGTYTLILETNENCSCLTPDTLIINVLTGETPGIECTGTICSGTEVTYYSEFECDSYIWDVSSEGTIIDGGGPLDYYITILWNNGPSGQVDLTTPGCLEMTCSESINVEIPILDGLANIDGPLEVCFGEESQYSIIDFQGTTVIWSLDGPGYIATSRYNNQIRIQWDNESDDKEAILKVYYENCNLGCSDSTSILITLKDPIFIQTNVNKYCSEAELNLENNLGFNVDWTILHPDGSESNFNNTPTLSTLLSDIGIHKISLSNPQSPTCNLMDEVSIEIIEAPEPPSAIIGPISICLNKTVQYEIPNLGLYDVVLWEVYDGSLSAPVLETSSRELTYVWSSPNGPYEIVAKIQNSITGCISESITLPVISGFTVEGPDFACLAEETTYSLLEYEGGPIEWNIVPSSSGSIIYNQGNNAVIVWLETGVHNVEANYCDNTEMVDVNIPPFDINVNFGIACANEKTEVEISTNSGSTVTITQFPENNLVSSSLSSELGAGEYLIEVTSPYGCYLSEEIIITEYDKFEVRITSPGPFAFCMPHAPIPITATLFGSGYTYEWYWNNNLLSESTNTLDASEYGTYYVIVTDENGCSDKSNNISLSEPVYIPGPPLVAEKIDIDCTNKSFTVLEPYESTAFSWSFGDGGFATGTTVDHTYSEAGHYIVVVQGNGGCIPVTGMSCDSEFPVTSCEADTLYVLIPAVADFEFGPSCIGEDVQFLDISTKVLNITGLIYAWDFGDPSSGASNFSSNINPFHRFDVDQSYDVTLTLSHPSTGCVTTITKTINIASKPDVSIDYDSEYCLGNSLEFNGSSSDPQVTYFWEFGETINGRPQISRDQNPQYSFSSSGNFLVKLTVKNMSGCTNTISQMVTIGQNMLTGEIETNASYPKCPGESVILSAPLAENYLWSNNETTREITVTDPSTYSVTITSAIGCEYIPFPHLVTDFNIYGAIIYATQYGEEGQSIHYHNLIICEGQTFNMQTSKLPNAEITWTGENVTGVIADVLDYDRFSDLSEGSYEFYANIKDTVGNCSIDIGPFALTIIENPNAPIIAADVEDPCEGDIVTISISNVEPDIIYTWNTGATGTSISTLYAGTYSVIATNINGCRNYSNYVRVNKKPIVNSWLTGCMEICFPHEICLSLNPFSNLRYELVKDGIIVGLINASNDILSIDEPGEYQMLATNKSQGCWSISDVLSLSAAPDEHSLSGIVYFDENENNIYDAMDELLENIPVHLYNGNTSVAQTLTDFNGYYEFDPVNYTNLSVVVDPSTTDLILEGELDSMLIYNECIEAKEINFPLIIACQHLQSDSTYSICPGGSILIEGVNYFSEDTDTLTYLTAKGCDSLYIFKVEENEIPEVQLTPAGSCHEDSNGNIIINIISGQNLMFSIDGETNYGSDLEFSDLSDGEYILNILDEHGCEYKTPFTIPLNPLVMFEVETSIICDGIESALVTIVPASPGMQFSLDDSLNFNPSLVYSNVGLGYHMMYAMSMEGCIDSAGFTIESLEEPTISFAISSVCENLNLGALTIDSSYFGSLFSLNGTDYSTDLVFEDLPVDQYILYYQWSVDCILEYPFEISSFSEPIIDLSNIGSCENENNGQLIIDTEESNLMFSVNKIDFFEDLILENLAGGEFTLFVQTPTGCLYEYPFDIPILQLPIVNADTENSCFNEANGSIIINNLSIGNMVSINSSAFSDELVYENLSSGLYSVQVKDQQQCTSTTEVEILENPELVVDISEYEEDCISEPITIAPNIISSFGPVTHQWSNGSTESQYFAHESENVSVTISDSCQSLFFEWNLNFLVTATKDNINVPNIFSPNADGFNDCFVTTIHPDILLISYTHTIFDRWGNKMFTSDSLDECWDGIYKGEPVIPGVYVYISKFLVDGCEGPYQIRKVGDVTVMR